MKRFLLALIICLSSISSKATHIAGGDFTVQWVSGNTYTVTLKLFRDCASGGAAFDNPISIRVFDNVTNAQTQVFSMNFISGNQVDLGDACYSPPASVCIEEGIYTATITLPNNPNGYYMAWERCCRNPTIQNITGPGNSGMVFYVQVPDPALQNSNPVFGAYPAEGYLCQGVVNTIDFEVTEVDGDSLVFSLIDPLMGSLSSNSNPAPNSANPKPYVTTTWQAPYSLVNTVGGVPPMTINSQTGIITCIPTGTGVFVFAVRIDEYRNGIKISETIRDIQYYVLNCVFDDLPEIMLPDSVAIAVGSTGCFDVVVIDQDITDSISILVSSPTFTDGATIGMPSTIVQTSPDTTYQFYFTNEFTGLADSIELPEPTFTNGAFYGVGGIGLQFCWQVSCQDIVGSPFILDVAAFSLGCSGDTNFINQTVDLYVVPQQPPTQEIYLPDTITLVARDATCFDMVVLSDDPTDTLNVIIGSSTFFDNATLQYPTPVSTNPNMYEFFYWNPSTSDVDSVILQEPTVNNGIYTGIGGIGWTYCWTTDCEDINDGLYEVTLQSFKIGCFGDTTFIEKTTVIDVNPPVGIQTLVPNVFTPNNDNINDDFKIMGISNYCYDSLNIKIYDRWGKLTFESDDPEFIWDGKNLKGNDASEGTYYVIINGIFGDADVTRQYPLTLIREKN